MFTPPTANQSWRKVLSMRNLPNGHEPILREIIFSKRDQAGILAVGRGNQVVVPFAGDERIEKPAVVTKMNLTLSADHRVFDGEVGGAFVGALQLNFSDIRRLLL